MIKANLEKILKEIPKGVTLVAATKQRSIDEINQAISCGVVAVGENYLSEARKKFESIGNKVRWHFIGHLQSNKARKAVALFDCIQTVDSLRLARKIDSFAEKPQVSEGRINGGFFVMRSDFIDNYLTDNPDLILERKPLSQCAKNGELVSFNHDGYWQPMDTYREYQILNKLWTEGNAPWEIWD